MLIIGPIGDFGGRELEAGFIANSLSDNYDVEICSIGNITKNSQVYETFKNGESALKGEDTVRKSISEKNSLMKDTVKVGN